MPSYTADMLKVLYENPRHTSALEELYRELGTHRSTEGTRQGTEAFFNQFHVALKDIHCRETHRTLSTWISRYRKSAKTAKLSNNAASGARRLMKKSTRMKATKHHSQPQETCFMFIGIALQASNLFNISPHAA
jgi:hypothetical protein